MNASSPDILTLLRDKKFEELVDSLVEDKTIVKDRRSYMIDVLKYAYHVGRFDEFKFK